MIERVLTIGVHGFSAASFLAALRGARVDVVVDTRARRGMRGREYAFANSRRLQAMLREAGIGYVHAREVAPSASSREAQAEADAKAGVSNRRRERVSAAFAAAYRRERLAALDPAGFLAAHCPGARRPALLCVEREPGACHRSLLAERLGEGLSARVVHLKP